MSQVEWSWAKPCSGNEALEFNRMEKILALIQQQLDEDSGCSPKAREHTYTVDIREASSLDICKRKLKRIQLILAFN